MANLLPHEAGVIAANIWAKLKASKEPQDLVDGYVVGQDNTTGQAIVTDGATRLKGEAENEVRIFKFATFERSESVAGGRLGKVRVSPSKSAKLGSKSLTQKSQPSRNVDGCGSGGVGGDSTDPARPDIPEAQLPSEPPTEPEPDPPPETIGAIAGASPQNPELSPTPESTSKGCDTVSDCQWLDAISLDQPCPYGTTKQGSTEITAGVFMILCCGEDRPVGDGCPVDSSQLGWTCVNGTCQQTQGGQFATQEECLASGCLKQTWTCTPNGCVEIFTGSGEFSSLEECQQQCAGLGWDCIGGFCQQVSGGRFNTQAECQASGCGAGSADPETGVCDGFFSATLTWSSGSYTSFAPPLTYLVTPPSTGGFTGGQCVGREYVVSMNYVADGVSYTSPFVGVGIIGPITSIRMENVTIGISDNCFLYVDHAAGAFSTNLSAGTLGAWSVNAVAPLDGLPDTCGDPPSSPDYTLTLTDTAGSVPFTYPTEPTGFTYTCQN